MRLGLVTDTHIPEVEKGLPPELLKALEGVDLILHGGDIYVPSVLDELERVAPVLAAQGDDDYGATLSDKRVKDKHILNIEGRILWLVHARPYYLNSLWWHNQNHPAPEDNPDVVIFGHEHRPTVEHVYDMLFVNSGSPTFLRYNRGLGTLGILDIDAEKTEARIIQL